MIKISSDYENWVSAEWRSYGGGIYLNPPQSIQNVGRMIVVPEGAAAMVLIDKAAPTFESHNLYQAVRAAVSDEECLFGLYNAGERWIAPLIIDAVDLVTFEAQVQNGELSRTGFFAVKKTIAERALGHAV